jgi:asparagine synthase (glutamine-hydrolysing)
MSGIVGIYYLDGRFVDRADLARMVETIAHRGPDGSGVWSEGRAGLGHRMLWTTPESLNERLPLVNQSGDLALTCDARIDNREELINLLCITNRPAGEISDSELILAAYEKWGEACPEKLLGDFAFAVWDSRKQTLFCARDHFGVKSFHYYSSPKTFIFATEIKALICLPEVPRQLDELKVADYLTAAFDDTAVTFFQEIRRLPAGYSVTVSREGIRLRSYWSLDPSRELRLSSNEEYAESFRAIFTEAVRCRLRSAFPVGSMLSGGLDSSSITCVARRLLSEYGQRRLHTFSAVFDKVTQCDERPYINAVLAQNNIEAHYLHADAVSPWAALDQMLWSQDEAFNAPNLFLPWGLYSTAQSLNVRVMLDGFDGDTTVSHGIRYLVELARSRRWVNLTKEVRGYTRNFDLPLLSTLWSYAWHHGVSPLLPNSRVAQFAGRKSRSLLRRALRRSDQIPNRPMGRAILHPDFMRQIGFAERRQTLKMARPGLPQTAREDHYRRLTLGVMPYTLEVMDRAAGAFSLEPRFPFWDKRLVEFCLALPPEQKMHQGWTRMVMRRAMTNILPREIQWRGGKSNLGPNFVQGMLVFERERLAEVIQKNPTLIENYVDLNAVRNVYKRFISQNLPDDNDVLAIYRAVSLALWLQRTGLTSQTESRRSQAVAAN